MPGRQPPSFAREVARERGLDLSEHRSVVLDEGLVGWADLVLVMDRRQARWVRRRFGARVPVAVLGDLDPGRPEARTIRDPVEQPREVFEKVYDRIEACCSEFFAALTREG